MFLVIFTALLGHGTVHVGGRTVHQSTYYVAAMASFAVITACYNNIAIAVPFQRDAGVLKRTNGTPLPAACTSPRGYCMPCSSRYCWSRSRSTFGKVVLPRRRSHREPRCSGSW